MKLRKFITTYISISILFCGILYIGSSCKMAMRESYENTTKYYNITCYNGGIKIIYKENMVRIIHRGKLFWMDKEGRAFNFQDMNCVYEVMRKNNGKYDKF